MKSALVRVFAAVLLILAVYLIAVPTLLSSGSVLLIALGVVMGLIPIIFCIDLWSKNK